MSNKCPICHKRKAKRKCLLYGAICSICCGKIRTSEKCPDDCIYFQRSTKLYANREIEKIDIENNVKIKYFEKNKERLILFMQEVEKRLVNVLTRDPYYNDEVLIDGIKKAQLYYSSKATSESDEISLNRVGVIESSIRDAVSFFQLKKGHLTTYEVNVTLEKAVYNIYSKIEITGKKGYFVQKLLESNQEDINEEKSKSIIIT